ncbi:MAG TPA: maleylpyruvate isomerase family mycothiol-dependent enzyme [Candidatus Dormibacteraeota bacterium]|jgi:maleylpyruvate isomerase|nr:maleylpyruvate isomerase family mycothiol-dependent enzyme [Candidatus Dormibacteraeota bacterium]
MELEPSESVPLCRASHRRLFDRVAGIDDATARRPSRLPGWTVGHLLAHLALHADGNVRRLEGALRGEEVPRYPGGRAERDHDIEERSGRPAAQLVSDLLESTRLLEEVWDRSERAGWPNADLLAGDHWPVSSSPLRRLREVEVHHVDLDLGYEAVDWPDAYVAWELQATLERVPVRLAASEDRRRLLTWLMGRSGAPERIRLDPWP